MTPCPTNPSWMDLPLERPGRKPEGALLASPLSGRWSHGECGVPLLRSQPDRTKRPAAGRFGRADHLRSSTIATSKGVEPANRPRSAITYPDGRPAANRGSLVRCLRAGEARWAQAHPTAVVRTTHPNLELTSTGIVEEVNDFAEQWVEWEAHGLAGRGGLLCGPREQGKPAREHHYPVTTSPMVTWMILSGRLGGAAPGWRGDSRCLGGSSRLITNVWKCGEFLARCQSTSVGSRRTISHIQK
jgi:hypothetical protein